MRPNLPSAVIGALILFSSLSVFASISDCQPAIYYQSISGNYIDQLGIKNHELEQQLNRLAKLNPKYCNMTVEIVYEEGLDPRQLVLKKNGTSRKDGYHFQLQYFAPAYKVKIKDKNGLILHDVNFEKELTFSTFKSPNKIAEEKELYDLWKEERENEYAKLEDDYNDFPRLLTYLRSIYSENTQALENSTNLTPTDSDIDPRPGAQDSLMDSKQPLASNRTDVSQTKEDLFETNQTIRARKSNTRNPRPNPRNQSSQNNSPKDAAIYSHAYTGLKGLIKFKVCSKESYSMFNRSYFTFNVEVGNTELIRTETHFIEEDKTLHLTNNLDKKSWFTLHYPLELHQLDMKKYARALKPIYRELNILEKGSEFIQDFIDELPDTYPRDRYEPSKDKVVKEKVDIRVQKFLGGLTVEVLKNIKEEELLDQIQFYHSLMARSYYLHYFYLEVKKGDLPKMLLKDLPNTRFKFPKRVTSTISLRGSVFALNAEEGVLNESWGTRTPSYRGIVQIGLPFEKSSKAAKNKEYYRPYLVVGYEMLNLPINATQTNFVGGDYVNGGTSDQEFQLATSEGIKLRSHSFQVGAVFKSLLPSDIYIDLGGGVRKKWRSQLIFDEGQNYLGNQNLNLLSNKQSDVLKTNHINPYFELTVGRDFNDNDKRNCSKDNVRLDVFFNAYIGRVNLEPGDNFQLYQSNFEGPTPPPFTTPAANDKWYLMVSMGIGFNLF